MKRAPEPRPEWIEICEIDHGSAGRINFPIIQDLPSLLWVINLGCIVLNLWYARCADTDRPDFLHFDLDPGPGANFAKVLEVALRVRDILGQLKMPTYPKTTGSKGIHVYIPIVLGPTQKEVWTFAKAIANELENPIRGSSRNRRCGSSGPDRAIHHEVCACGPKPLMRRPLAGRKNRPS